MASKNLQVGDLVVITKRHPCEGEYQYRWIEEMDYTNGMTTKIKAIEEPFLDNPIAFELEIDDGEFGYLEHWLDKAS